jgi:hypothetical protein
MAGRATFERVTYQADGGRSVTVILRNPRESKIRVPGHSPTPVLSGAEVDRDGASVGRSRVIQRSLIHRRTRLVDDLHYGGLVPEAEESAQSRATRRLADYEGLADPGTRVWVYGAPEPFPGTVQGLSVSTIERIFGGTDQSGPELCPPVLAITRDDTGETVQATPRVTARREDAERAWHVIDRAGRVVAGGPPIFGRDQAEAIATRYGQEHTVCRGIAQAGRRAGQ